MNHDGIDWLQVGKNLGELFVGIVVVWTAFRTGRHEKRTIETRNAVQKLCIATDGNLSEQLHIGMIAARALAATTGLAEHKELAEVAEKKYYTHKEQLAKQEYRP